MDMAPEWHLEPRQAIRRSPFSCPPSHGLISLLTRPALGLMLCTQLAKAGAETEPSTSSQTDHYDRDMAEIQDLAANLRAFADARDWAQFHSLRNLVLALAGEVGELAAEVQWIPDDSIAQALADPTKRSAVESEIADVASYIIRIADVLGIDLGKAIRDKLALNETRYPANLARGNAQKYDELGKS